jgi:hypothetical protein
MSALPPKADSRPPSRKVRFGPISDIGGLLDHLVGAVEKRERDRQAECLSGLEIDDQFDFRGLLNRQIGRFEPLTPLSMVPLAFTQHRFELV